MFVVCNYSGSSNRIKANDAPRRSLVILEEEKQRKAQQLEIQVIVAA
jgi:hypothetical protein